MPVIILQGKDTEDNYAEDGKSEAVYLLYSVYPLYFVTPVFELGKYLIFDRMSVRGAHLILRPWGGANSDEALFREGVLIKYFSKNVDTIFFPQEQTFLPVKSIYKRNKEIMNVFLSEFFFNIN